MRRLCSSSLAFAVVLALALPAGQANAAPAADEPVLPFLNECVRWARQVTSLQQQASEPSDVVYASDVRHEATQVERLAFEYGRAAVALQAPQAPAAAGPETSGKASAAQLAGLAARAAAQMRTSETNVQALERTLESAQGKRRRLAQDRLAEEKSELALFRARADTLKSMAEFLAQSGTGTGGAGLLGQIEALERTVPGARAADNQQEPRQPAPAAAAQVQASRAPEPNGVIALASDLFALSRKRGELSSVLGLTGELRGAVEKLRAPLLVQLRATLQRADALAQAADTPDPAQLEQRTRDIGELTGQFKQISAALMPLGKQSALLDSSRATLGDWRGSTDSRYGGELRSLLLRLGLLAVAIAVVLAGSAFWRRATFRYVRDPRRRQQSLLVRRIVITVAVVLLVAFSLVNELGSLATFAGFITAGLAVALQSVILSVAAYFFLIGKYGIRVGDRVQIGEVSGDVIDLSLTRLHLMELRSDGLPTGRVVVFSNAAAFQGNFFKQLPGSNFAWHQVKLTLSPDSDYKLAETRLMPPVEAVYAQFRDDLVAQHQRVSEMLSIAVTEPRPQSQLHFTESGLEMVIRFAVPLDKASAMDDLVTRGLLDAIGREPRLKMLGSGKPTIEAVNEPPRPLQAAPVAPVAAH